MVDKYINLTTYKMKDTQITQHYVPDRTLPHNEQSIRSKIKYPTVESALDLTRLRKFAEEVEKIRNEPDETKQKLLKEELLPMINYYGYFYKIWDVKDNKYKLIIDKNRTPTGILVIDLDRNKKTATWEQFLKEAKKLDQLILDSVFAKYIAFIFKSPRNGWKIGVKTDIRTHDASEYKEKYITLIEVFQMLLKRTGFMFKYSEVDYHCSDIIRRHFVSDDEKMYINYNAVDYPLSKLRKREDSRKNKRQEKKAQAKVTNNNKQPKEADEFYNRDVNNKLFNYSIINEIMERVKNNEKFSQSFIQQLNIASRNNDDFNKLMFCLQSAIGFNDAENVFKTILAIAGVFNPQIFKKKWYKVTNPETNINYLLTAAKKAGFPFDKKDYGLIKRVEENRPKLNVKPPKIDFTVEKFITDKLSDIINFINKHEFIQIVAPTSSGKTELVCKHLPEKLNSIVTLSVPYIALADGIQHKYKEKVEVFHSRKEGKNPKEYMLSKSVVHVSTFDTTPKFNEIFNDELKSESVLVLDELHQILAAYNFRGDKIRALIKFASGFKKVIGLTGTPLPESIMQLSPFLKKFKTIRFANKDPKGHVVNFDYSNKIEQSIIDRLKKHKGSGKKWAIYMNDKQGNIEIARELEDLGFKTMIINSDTDKEDERVQQLKETSLIPDDVDVLIVTSALRDGFNIENKDVAGICFYKMQPIRDIVQFSSRFREVTGLEIWIHGSSTSAYHLNNCYSPELIRKEYGDNALAVVENVNDIQIPTILSRGVVSEISEYDFNDIVDYAIRYHSDKNVRCAISNNKDDYSTAWIDDEGLAYYALRKHDESECSNPIFFVSELLNYGFKIGKVNSPSSTNSTNNKKHMNGAKNVINHELVNCKNEKEYDDLLANIQSADLITGNGICNVNAVNQKIIIIGERASELKSLGYKSKSALEEAVKFDSSSKLFNEFKRLVEFGTDRRTGNVQKYENFLQYEKGGIKKGVEISTKDWKSFLQNAKDKTGDTTKDLPFTELSKYYQIKENKSKRTIKIIGLAEPDIIPDDIPYTVDLKKYGVA